MNDSSLLTVLTLSGIVIYLALMAFIAHRAYKTNIAESSQDWYLMGRTAGLFMLVGTLFATWFSTFAFLGGPGTFYLRGVDWLLFGFFNSMGPLLILFFGVRMWILGKRYGFITPADLLSFYYDDSPRMRYLTAAVCLTVLFPYAAIQLSGISIALESISGGLVSFEVGVIGLAVCVGLYAVFGGTRAIIWTDVVQGFIFAILIIITAVLAVNWAGGWATGWANAVDAEPSKFLFSGGTAGSYITLMLLWTFGWILTPHLWQRMYMARSPKVLVQGSVIASFMALLVVTFSGAVIGFMAMGMDVDMAGRTSDALVPLLYSQFLPIMGAVLVVAVFAAGMSTLDSQIISASSVFTEDVYRRGRDSVDSRRKIQAGRLFEVVFVGLVIGFVLSEAGRQLLIPLASIGVGMALVFLMPLIGCLFWPRGTEAGAFYAMLSGWLVMMGIQFGLVTFLPTVVGPPVYGFVVSLVVFYAVSLMTTPVSAEKQRLVHGLLRETFRGQPVTPLQAPTSPSAKA